LAKLWLPTYGQGFTIWLLEILATIRMSDEILILTRSCLAKLINPALAIVRARIARVQEAGKGN